MERGPCDRREESCVSSYAGKEMMSVDEDEASEAMHGAKE